jgi:hypothetical protein
VNKVVCLLKPRVKSDNSNHSAGAGTQHSEAVSIGSQHSGAEPSNSQRSTSSRQSATRGRGSEQLALPIDFSEDDSFGQPPPMLNEGVYYLDEVDEQYDLLSTNEDMDMVDVTDAADVRRFLNIPVTLGASTAHSVAASPDAIFTSTSAAGSHGVDQQHNGFGAGSSSNSSSFDPSGNLLLRLHGQPTYASSSSAPIDSGQIVFVDADSLQIVPSKDAMEQTMVTTCTSALPKMARLPRPTVSIECCPSVLYQVRCCLFDDAVYERRWSLSQHSPPTV